MLSVTQSEYKQKTKFQHTVKTNRDSAVISWYFHWTSGERSDSVAMATSYRMCLTSDLWPLDNICPHWAGNQNTHIHTTTVNTHTTHTDNRGERKTFSYSLFVWLSIGQTHTHTHTHTHTWKTKHSLFFPSADMWTGNNHSSASLLGWTSSLTVICSWSSCSVRCVEQ